MRHYKTLSELLAALPDYEGELPRESIEAAALLDDNYAGAYVIKQGELEHALEIHSIAAVEVGEDDSWPVASINQSAECLSPIAVAPAIANAFFRGELPDLSLAKKDGELVAVVK